MGWPGEYGFFWWTRPYYDTYTSTSYNCYGAIGLGGQEIWVIPEADLVVVLTTDLGFMGPDLINRYLLKAVQSDTPLPDNPEAFALLQAQVDALTHPTPAAVQPLNKTAQQISGQIYALEDNPLGWKSLELDFGEQDALLKLDTGLAQLELPIGLDGVDRVSSAGLPADPVWWPLDDIPLALQGSWYTSSTFLIYMRDLRGMLDFEITMNCGQTVYATVNPRLPLLSALWDTPSITLVGTPR